MNTLSQRMVLSLLNSEDIEGLLAAGAPTDEYETEAAMITELLGGLSEGEWDLDRVTTIVADVCGQMFGPFAEDELNRRLPGYRRLARLIVQEHHGRKTPDAST